MASADVVVLGGGPAGLAAAWWAARTGRSVVLLERAAAFGGLAASFEVAGVRVDHGSHRLHPATAPHVMAELRGLLGDDLQQRQRRGRLRLANRWFDFPPSPAQMLRTAPPALAMALARDLVTSPLRRPGADTYAEVVRAGVGPTLGEHLYFPFARKLWGTAPEDLDGEQARRRIKANSPAAIAGKALRRAGSNHFFYPRRGFGQIAEALADAAVAAGAVLRAETTVTDLKHIDADVVMSTIPLRSLVGAANAPGDIVDAAGAQRARGVVLVYLVLDRSPWTTYDAHYLPQLELLAHRVSEPSNYRESNDDPTDRTVLCAEVPCWPGDDTWRLDDDELIRRVVDDLGRLGLPRATPIGSEVRRVTSVYPVYPVGFAPALAAVEAWIGALPNVITLGRQGLFAHDNTHHTLEMAFQAVAVLTADGAVDRPRWNAARETFRAHVVED
ncbi:MAG TPA: FAD-dependent oxidoreductase [Acidimicrobiales bacterium]|nr:FAD-dependent oxidoreductase [Acidimicrobiales bacterium]